MGTQQSTRGAALGGGQFHRRLFWGCLLLAFVSAGAIAGSIFDDDWVSPSKGERTTVQPPVKKPVLPEVKPETRPDGVEPDSLTVQGKVPAVVPVRVARLAVPAKDAQAASRKLMKDVFAKQLKDQTKAGRQKLVQDLLGEVPKLADSPVDRFVVIAGAIDAGREAADVTACLMAADLMAVNYEVDGLDVKRDLMLKLPPVAYAGAGADENVRAGMEVVDELLEADEVTTATKVLAMLQQAKVKDGALKAMVGKRMRELEAARLAEQKVAPQLAVLKTTPDDAGANLAVGSYWCFVRGQWERGLGMLAKGSDVELKKIAEMEIAVGGGTEGSGETADKWWEAAGKMVEPQRTKVRQHASALYQRELMVATGLRKTLMEKRIAEAPPEEGRVVNLLAMVDLTKDVAGGTWVKAELGFKCEPARSARIEFPYLPPKEYDFKIVFNRLKGRDSVDQILTATGRQFNWTMNDLCGFEVVNGKGFRDNETTVRHAIESGQRYTSVVKIRKNGTQAYLDGKLISSWKTDFRGASVAGDKSLRRPDTIGVSCWDSETLVESAELLEISGEGKRLR